MGEAKHIPDTRKQLVLAYAGLAYLAFSIGFGWLIVFLMGVGPWPGVDAHQERDPLGVALLVDVGLLLVFALQHSIMARPRFKAWFTRRLPPAAERATFTLASSLALGLLCWQWRPVDTMVWDVEMPALRVGLIGLSLLAWAGAGLTTFIHDHFEFYGLRQAWDHLRGLSRPPTPLREVSAYRYVRHPMMSAILVALWSAPTMSVGHLILVLGLSAYLVIGLVFEERGLRRVFGDAYADYQRRVPMLIPRLWPR